MTSVQFRTGSAATNGRPVQIIVDDHDITEAVYDEGFEIIRVSEPLEPPRWGVRMTIAADDLDVDIADAVLNATTRDGEA